MLDIQSGKSTCIERDHCGLLFVGLVVDAAGQPLLPSSRTVSGASQYYRSASSAGARIRIPGGRLDRAVVGVLKRIGLLREGWQPNDLAMLVDRVVVAPDVLELQIYTRACLALWRTRNPSWGRATVARVLAAMRADLTRDEVLEEWGTKLHLSMPRLSRNRCAIGGRARTMQGAEYGGASTGY